MLVLSRNVGQSIIINGNIKITILPNTHPRYGTQVRIGIEAPAEINIRREELIDNQDWTQKLLGAGEKI